MSTQIVITHRDHAERTRETLYRLSDAAEGLSEELTVLIGNCQAAKAVRTLQVYTRMADTEESGTGGAHSAVTVRVRLRFACDDATYAYVDIIGPAEDILEPDGQVDDTDPNIEALIIFAVDNLEGESGAAIVGYLDGAIVQEPSAVDDLIGASDALVPEVYGSEWYAEDGAALELIP